LYSERKPRTETQLQVYLVKTEIPVMDHSCRDHYSIIPVTFFTKILP